MANVNYLRSISPLFNAASAIAQGESIFGDLYGNSQSPSMTAQRRGPLASALVAPAGSPQATQYRPPTQVYQGKGQGFRDTTPQERSQYNVAHLSDRRNVGYGRGQVDPGLARAAVKKESDKKSGGK